VNPHGPGEPRVKSVNSKVADLVYATEDCVVGIVEYGEDGYEHTAVELGGSFEVIERAVIISGKMVTVGWMGRGGDGLVLSFNANDLRYDEADTDEEEVRKSYEEIFVAKSQ